MRIRYSTVISDLIFRIYDTIGGFINERGEDAAAGLVFLGVILVGVVFVDLIA